LANSHFWLSGSQSGGSVGYLSGGLYLSATTGGADLVLIPSDNRAQLQKCDRFWPAQIVRVAQELFL